MELKREVTANRGNLEDLNEIDRVLANIDAEVAKYLDDNSQLKVEYLLEHLEKVVIYPDKAVVIIPILCEGFVVDKAQYVSREKRRGKVHHYEYYDRVPVRDGGACQDRWI